MSAQVRALIVQLRERRRELRWSIHDVGARACTEGSTVQKFEQKSDCHISKLEQIADVLGFDVVVKLGPPPS